MPFCPLSAQKLWASSPRHHHPPSFLRQRPELAIVPSSLPLLSWVSSRLSPAPGQLGLRVTSLVLWRIFSLCPCSAGVGGEGEEGSVWLGIQRAGWHGFGEAWLSEVIQANGSLATGQPQWERRRRNVSTCLINGSKGDSKANRSWERDTKRKQPFLCSVPFICHSSLCS